MDRKPKKDKKIKKIETPPLPISSTPLIVFPLSRVRHDDLRTSGTLATAYDILRVGESMNSFEYALNKLNDYPHVMFTLHVYITDAPHLIEFIKMLEPYSNVERITLCVSHDISFKYADKEMKNFDRLVETLSEYLTDNKSVSTLCILGGIFTTEQFLDFLESIIGNTHIDTVDFVSGASIIDNETDRLVDIILQTNIRWFNWTANGSIPNPYQRTKIRSAVETSLDERLIPIKSKTKSAAKIT